jgi:hypothetical protein
MSHSTHSHIPVKPGDCFAGGRQLDASKKTSNEYKSHVDSIELGSVPSSIVPPHLDFLTLHHVHSSDCGSIDLIVLKPSGTRQTIAKVSTSIDLWDTF